MTPTQDLILRGTIRTLRAKGWSDANIRNAVQAQAASIGPPSVARSALDTLFRQEAFEVEYAAWRAQRIAGRPLLPTKRDPMVAARMALDRRPAASYTSAMNIGTRLFTMLKGLRVGSDAVGNIYYQERRPRSPTRTRRWVMYAGIPDASAVPPEWHAWLHHTTDAPLPDTGRKPWQKPHMPNLTGTPAGYRPPGHDYEGGHRARATGDYEAWTPGS